MGGKYMDVGSYAVCDQTIAFHLLKWLSVTEMFTETCRKETLSHEGPAKTNEVIL